MSINSLMPISEQEMEVIRFQMIFILFVNLKHPGPPEETILFISLESDMAFQMAADNVLTMTMFPCISFHYP